MKRSPRAPIPLLCGLALAVAGTLHGAFPTLALKAVVLKQIHSPTTITSAGDGSGRLFVCDQVGKIYIIQGGMMMPMPFLNIASPDNSAGNTGPGPVLAMPPLNYSERGLLGLAFHPGFGTQASPGYRKFYVYYNKAYVAGTDPAPPLAGDPVSSVTVVSEFQVSASNPNLADIASERRILMFTRPQSNHNGGQLEFGPDGYLYIGSGDGGQQEDNNAGHTGGSASKPTNAFGNGQDKTRYLGKILRIDPLDPDGAGPLTYGIPPTNPFVGAGGGVKEEIYSFGMRNPWRFSFDKRPGGTNRLFCGDVGGNRIEEVDIIVAGGNYGWRYKEGHEFPTFSSAAPTNPMPDPLQGPYIDPIAEYAHPGVTTTAPVLPQLGLSVTGGFVYRGSAIPALQGKYVFGDYGTTSGASDGRLMGLEETSPLSGVFTLTQALPLIGTNPIVGQRILCFGEDEAGEIYVGLKTNSGVLALGADGLPAGGIYKLVTPPPSASITITAEKDNTIFSEDSTPTAEKAFWPFTSDGRGYLYAGHTDSANYGSYNRRALVSFNLAPLAGAIIQSAQLKLNLNKPGPSSSGTSITVNRLTETWGEGTSNNSIGGYGAAATTNDATWSRRFYNTFSWTTAGGTYSTASSATATVAAGLMTWGSTSQLVGDVQGWIITPISNAGWILRGDETVEQTACRFDSAQSGSTAPALVLTYLPPSHFDSWLFSQYPANAVGKFVDPNGDDDGDGIKNQIEYAYGLSPTGADGTGDFSTSTGPSLSSPGDTDLTVTFRRDTAATDLIYKLQSSSDLMSWITIGQSTAGAAAVGQNGGVIVSDVTLTGTVNLVTVRQTIPVAAADKRFVRVQVDRQ